MEIVGAIWNHLTGIIGTIVTVTAVISVLIFLGERRKYAALQAAERRKEAGKRRSIAIITGASGGLGRQYARQLDARAEKFDIQEFWLIARREEKLLEAAQELKHPARCFAMDVTDEKAREELCRCLEKEKQDDPDFSVGLLLNCAGFGKQGTSEKIGAEEECRMIELNDKAAVAMTALVLPYMTAGSRIGEVCSVAGFQPIPTFNAYAASKAFLYTYSRGLRTELLPKGISVTAVAPYWIHDTDFIPTAYGKKKRLFLSSKVASVSRISLGAIRRRQALSTPGIICTLERVFAGLIPDGVLGYIMKWFL